MGLDGRQVPSAGESYSSAERDRLALASALPSSLFALGVDFSKKTGQTVRINRPAFTDSTYTLASRRLATGQTISTTSHAVGSEQTHLTLERFGGPYASSTIKPYAIEAFDANMGMHSLASQVGTHLKRDFDKFLDTVLVTIASAGTAVYPEGMTANNDATVADMFPMTVEQIMRTEQLMNEANLPTFADGKRLMVLTAKQVKQLKHDPEYAINSEAHPSFNLLFNGAYISTVCGFHVFMCETLTKPTNGSTVPVHTGIAMSPGGLMGGVGRKPRVAFSTDDNYGETTKLIWLADLAFGISDSRLFRTICSA